MSTISTLAAPLLAASQVHLVTWQVREMLKFHNSAPHHYWGLYFLDRLRLRARGEVGHMLLAYYQ